MLKYVMPEGGLTSASSQFTLSTGQNGRQKQLKRVGKQCRPRRFWVRPGRTSAWWDNFVNAQ